MSSRTTINSSSTHTRIFFCTYNWLVINSNIRGNHFYFSKNIMIIWIFEKIVKHLDAKRKHDFEYYKIFENVFQILNVVYDDFNWKRNARTKFDKFQMKFDQIFVDFFSNFILLTNQLNDYSKIIKMNRLKIKIIYQFRQVIATSKSFFIVKVLKKKLLSIDIRMRDNRVNNFLEIDERNKTRNVKTIVKTTINYDRFNFDRFKQTREFNDIEQQVYNNLVAKRDKKDCYNCDSFEHFVKNCSKSRDQWMNVEIKKKIIVIQVDEMQNYAIKNFEVFDAINDTSSDIFFDSKN